MSFVIIKDFSHEIEIKKSRFICYLKRVKSEEKARDFILSLKKEEHKANHHCSAFVLGERQEIQRTSDDGEPSGTAGVPMLEVLKKREVTNICAVVTRYFGGIKLGAGGLIRAYSGSVSQALDAVGLAKIVTQQELVLQLDYALYDSLTNYLQVSIADSIFTDKVQVKIYLDLAEVDEFLTDLTEKFNGKVEVTKGSKQLVEVPI